MSSLLETIVVDFNKTCWSQVEPEDLSLTTSSSITGDWTDNAIKNYILKKFPLIADTDFDKIATLCAAFLTGCNTTFNFPAGIALLGYNITSFGNVKFLDHDCLNIPEKDRTEVHSFSAEVIASLDNSWKSMSEPVRAFILAACGKTTDEIPHCLDIITWADAVNFARSFANDSRDSTPPSSTDNARHMGLKIDNSLDLENIIKWISTNYPNFQTQYPNIKLFENKKTFSRIFYSFIGLIFGRNVQKNWDPIKTYLNKSTFVAKLGNIINDSYPMLPPNWISAEVLERLSSMYSSPRSENYELFKRCVGVYSHYRHNPEPSKFIDSVLMAGILAHTAGLGLGVITSIARLSLRLNISPYYVLQLVGTSYLGNDVKLSIWKFFKMYVAQSLSTKDKNGEIVVFKSYSWKWARIIEPQLWTNMTESNQIKFACLLSCLELGVQPKIKDKEVMKKMTSSLPRISLDAWLLESKLKDLVEEQDSNLESNIERIINDQIHAKLSQGGYAIDDVDKVEAFQKQSRKLYLEIIQSRLSKGLSIPRRAKVLLEEEKEKEGSDPPTGDIPQNVSTRNWQI